MRLHAYLGRFSSTLCIFVTADTPYAEADEMKNDFETGTSAFAVPSDGVRSLDGSIGAGGLRESAGREV